MNHVRLPMIQLFKFIGVLAQTILCTCLYNGSFAETREGVQNMNGALFFVSMICGFQGLSNVTLVFPAERPVFMREVNNGMYRVSSYFWSKIFSEIPFSVGVPLIMMVMLYYGCGFNNNDWFRLPVFIIIAVVAYNAFGGFGFILGSSIAKKEVLNILMPVIIVPTMLFAGFFVNQDNVPAFLKPFEHIAIHKYALEAFMWNQYDGLTLACQ